MGSKGQIPEIVDDPANLPPRADDEEETHSIVHGGCRYTNQEKKNAVFVVEEDVHVGGNLIGCPNIAAQHEDVHMEDQFLFSREVRSKQVDQDGTDYSSLQEGYITVTPISALFNADIDGVTFFNKWLPSLDEHSNFACKLQASLQKEGETRHLDSSGLLC
nr:Survival protein SurE-like phosphatase/nucleotidase [Ipomoea batatas]